MCLSTVAVQQSLLCTSQPSAQLAIINVALTCSLGPLCLPDAINSYFPNWHYLPDRTAKRMCCTLAMPIAVRPAKLANSGWALHASRRCIAFCLLRSRWCPIWFNCFSLSSVDSGVKLVVHTKVRILHHVRQEHRKKCSQNAGFRLFEHTSKFDARLGQ